MSGRAGPRTGDTAAGGAAGLASGAAGLAQVQEHAVELLGKLRRHPSNLRIQVADITVDLTWAPEPEHNGRSLPGVIADGHETHTQDGEAEPREYLRSPAVGVFYHAQEPGAEPFVSVGSLVEPGQQVGIVEAMKLMIPVAADRSGTISDVLKPNGAPVEYDEPLFAVLPTEA